MKLWFFIVVLLLAGPVWAPPAPFKKANNVEFLFTNPFLPEDYLSNRNLVDDWGWERAQSAASDTRSLEVPSQTGRGVIAPVTYSSGNMVFLKGTGLNPEQLLEVGAIRYPIFPGQIIRNDGLFPNREALFDIYNSEFLSHYGVSVARPLGILKRTSEHSKKGAQAGIYAREFIIQTRLSNLQVMSPEQAKAEIDQAIETLYVKRETPHKLNYVEYYFWLMHEMARNVGIMQAVGFEHGVLHSQQFTLAGELVDLGTGRWKHDPGFNPFFEAALPSQDFEHQPLTTLNMLTRTHSLSSSKPVVLNENSETRKLQKKSLLGVFKAVDPKAAEQIEKLRPADYFWQVFDFSYQTIAHEATRDSFRPSSFFPASGDVFESTIKGKHGKPTKDKAGQIFNDLKQELQMDHVPLHLLVQQYQRAKPGASFWVPDLPELYTPIYPQGLQEPNYFIDEEIQQHLNADFIAAPTRQIPKLREGQLVGVTNEDSGEITSTTLPSKMWGIEMRRDPTFMKYVDDFKTAVLGIKKKYQNLDRPEAIRALITLIATTNEWEYGATLEGSRKEKYDNWVQKRYDDTQKGLTRFSDLVKNCAGECHDAALASTVLGVVLESVDPRFKIQLYRNLWTNYKGKPQNHYFALLWAPNNRLYFIDTLRPVGNNVTPLERVLTPSYPEATRRGPNPLNLVTMLVDTKVIENGSCKFLYKALGLPIPDKSTAKIN